MHFSQMITNLYNLFFTLLTKIEFTKNIQIIMNFCHFLHLLVFLMLAILICDKTNRKRETFPYQKRNYSEPYSKMLCSEQLPKNYIY